MSKIHLPSKPKSAGNLKLRGPASPEAIQKMFGALKATSDRLNGSAEPLSAERKKIISQNIMDKMPPLSSKVR